MTREGKTAAQSTRDRLLTLREAAEVAGCYGAAPSVRIHLPKCGEDYRTWLERWEAKGGVQ